VNYKNKDWLTEQIRLGRTNASIAEDFKVNQSNISYYIKKFNLKSNKKKKKHNDRGWLHQKYIVEELSAREVGEISGVSPDMILLKLKEFDIKKSNDLIVKSRRNTMMKRYKAPTSLESNELLNKINKTKLDRYGTVNTSSLEFVIESMKKTSVERYGVDTFLNTKIARESLRSFNIENKKEHNIFDRSIRSWSLEYKVPHFSIKKYIESQAVLDYNSFILHLKSYNKSISNIENLIEERMGFSFYNKLFDSDNYPDLRYKPDFKISDKVALNVDGLYWHSEYHKDKFYHFNMRREFEERGLRIFQFRSDEVESDIKLNIINSMLDYNLNKISKRIFARKTKVRSISQAEANKFLAENHIMGSISSKHIGLIHNDEIVSIYSYRIRNNVMNVDRYCSKIDNVVIGGFGKLLKNSIKNNSKVNTIDFWVDLRYGTGTFLSEFNFRRIKDTLSWKWTNSISTYNRLKCRANMDDRRLTQKQYANELKWYKIYDAGQRLYRLNLEKNNEN